MRIVSVLKPCHGDTMRKTNSGSGAAEPVTEVATFLLSTREPLPQYGAGKKPWLRAYTVVFCLIDENCRLPEPCSRALLGV